MLGTGLKRFVFMQRLFRQFAIGLSRDNGCVVRHLAKCPTKWI